LGATFVPRCEGTKKSQSVFFDDLFLKLKYSALIRVSIIKLIYFNDDAVYIYIIKDEGRR